MGASKSQWLTFAVLPINKTTGLTATYNLYLTNKPQLTSDAGDFATFPILLGGVRVGTASDREMILPDSGNITVDNSIGSFGVDRKLSDIFDYYEIVDQPMSIYSSSTEPTALLAGASTAIYSGKVLSWSHSIDQGRPTIQIEFDTKVIPKRVITKVINATDFPTAPISAISKALPIVFGSSIQVKPIPITANTSTAPAYAYATTLNNEHAVGGVATYYAKDPNGRYLDVVTSGAANTAVISRTAGTLNLNVASAEQVGYLKLAVIATDNYIMSYVEVGFNGDGVASVHDGAITVKIFETTAGGVPGSQSIASGQVNAATYDASFDGAADFFIGFSLDKPVILDSSKDYWISIKHEYISPNPVSANYASTGVTPIYYRTSPGNGWVNGGTVGVINMKVYGVLFTDTPGGSLVDNSGLGAAYFTLTQHSSSTTDLNKLDLIVAVNGLKDDSSGNITGSASSQITTAHHALKLLSQTWNGSAWSINTTYWDFSEFSDTYFSTNAIAGRTDGETTFEQWARQVCRNSGTKLAVLNDSRVAPYSWGTTRTSQATLNQENSKVTSMDSLDATYVVNGITVAYARALIYFDSIIAASQGITSDYTASIRLTEATGGEYTSIIGVSKDIYGVREYADIFFNWINSSDAAYRIARYFLTNFNTPPQYVEIEAPFQDFSDLAIMDVVTIAHPSLPNYYGGIPNAKLPHYLGEEVDVNAGYNLCEARQYRAQIESRKINFSDIEAPTVTFTCRLLKNYPNDPT